MDHVLIDTDVLLDFFFDRDPHSEYAAEILNQCAEDQLKGFTTAAILSNVYYLLRKSAQHGMVIEKLNQLLTIIDIVEMNRNSVLAALNSDFKDFEDALQNYAAVNSEQISIILTRNIKDFKKSELAVMTPQTYLKGKI